MLSPCSEKYWAGVGPAEYNYENRDTLADVQRGNSKRSMMTIHVRQDKESPLKNNCKDDIIQTVYRTFGVNGLELESVQLWVGVPKEKSEDPRDRQRYRDVTHAFEEDEVITDEYHLKIKVTFTTPEEAMLGFCIALFEQREMKWYYYGDPNAKSLISCHVGWQSQFIPGVLVALSKKAIDEVKEEREIQLDLMATWDSLGKKVKQTFARLRAMSMEPIFKGGRFASLMKTYLATTLDDTIIGPELVKMLKEIEATVGIAFMCKQLGDTRVLFSTVRMFLTADRKAMRGLLGSPYNQFSVLFHVFRDCRVFHVFHSSSQTGT